MELVTQKLTFHLLGRETPNNFFLSSSATDYTKSPNSKEKFGFLVFVLENGGRHDLISFS